jgi:hypothetical protein
MNEDVLSAVLWCDETEAFVFIEKTLRFSLPPSSPGSWIADVHLIAVPPPFRNGGPPGLWPPVLFRMRRKETMELRMPAGVCHPNYQEDDL